MNNNYISNAIATLQRLPGVGGKTAQRYVIHMLEQKDTTLKSVINTLENLYNNVKHCELCNNYSVDVLCDICSSSKRENSLCIIENVISLWNIEEGGFHKGRYFIIDNLFENININTNQSMAKISNIINKLEIKEIIVALSLNIKSTTIQHALLRYLQDKHADIKVSTLAQGIPIGSDLEYIDNATLFTAFKGRTIVK